MQTPNETDTAVAEQAPKERKITRRMADFYVRKTFGQQVRLRFQPARPYAYAVVARQPGTSVLLVLGEGNTVGEAINVAIKALQPEAPVAANNNPEEVKK